MHENFQDGDWVPCEKKIKWKGGCCGHPSGAPHEYFTTREYKIISPTAKSRNIS